MPEELNVTNAVHPHLRVQVIVGVAEVVTIEVEVVVDMVVVEVVIMVVVEAVNIMEVEAVIMMVEVGEAIGVVHMEKKKVYMVRLLQQHHNLFMVGLVATSRHLTIHMVRTQIMEWMLFLRLQTMLEGLHRMHHLMAALLWVVMVVMVLEM